MTSNDLNMITCKQCTAYAENIFNRGEIEKDEIGKIAADRHKLSMCGINSSIICQFKLTYLRENKEIFSSFEVDLTAKDYMLKIKEKIENFTKIIEIGKEFI